MTACLRSGAELLVAYPIAELVLLLIAITSVASHWRGLPAEKAEDSVNERQLAASVITAQLSGIITASSIIIVGVGGFAALLSGRLAGNLAAHIMWAAIFAVAGMAVALYSMATLPPRVEKHNVAYSKGVAILSATALFLALLAGVRLILAIRNLS